MVTVDYEAFKAAGLVKKHLDGAKVLGCGKLEKKPLLIAGEVLEDSTEC